MNLCEHHNDFTAILEPADEGGFIAFCAEVPGANGQGETQQAAIENLTEAIKLILQVNRDERFADMSEDAACYKVSVHETLEAVALSPGTRLRSAS